MLERLFVRQRQYQQQGRLKAGELNGQNTKFRLFGDLSDDVSDMTSRDTDERRDKTPAESKLRGLR